MALQLIPKSERTVLSPMQQGLLLAIYLNPDKFYDSLSPMHQLFVRSLAVSRDQALVEKVLTQLLINYIEGGGEVSMFNRAG